MAVVERRRKSEAEKFIQRNTLFLSEVNHLREQNRKLEQRCKKYMRRALVATEMSKRLSAPERGTGTRKPALPQEARGAITHEKSAQQQIKHENLWEHRPRTGAALSGTVLKGTTRPLTAVANLKRQLQNSQSALDQAQTTVELQKLEISLLQEGVTVALDLAQKNFSNFSNFSSTVASGQSTAHHGPPEIDFTMSPSPRGSRKGSASRKSRPITPHSVGPFTSKLSTPPGLGLGGMPKRHMRVSQSAASLRSRPGTGQLGSSASTGRLPVPGSSSPTLERTHSPSLKMTTLYSGKRPI